MKQYKWIFESIECLILCSFLSIDLGICPLLNGSMIKYCGIILCFFYVVFMYLLLPILHKSSKNEISRETWCTVFASFFVLIADYFLLFTNEFFIGISVFFLVQCIYYIRLNGFHLKPMDWYIGIAFIILLLLSRAGLVQTADVVVATCYASLSIGNCIRAAFSCQNKRFTIAIFLLLVCDFHVMVANLSSYVGSNVIPFYVVASARILMWVFYLPSQVIMATSVSYDCNKND